MEKRNSRFDVARVAHLKLQARERVDQALADWTPAEVLGHCPVGREKSVDVGLHDHAAPALRAGLGLVESLISLYKSGEDILVPFEDFQDLALVHLFEDHQGTVYLNGGSSGLSN